MKNEMKINSRRKHTVEELAKLPRSSVTETQYKQLRSLVFIKGLDIVQAHKASGLLRTKNGRNVLRGITRFATKIGRHLSACLLWCTSICLNT